jgi:hypothetical protein
VAYSQHRADQLLKLRIAEESARAVRGHHLDVRAGCQVACHLDCFDAGHRACGEGSVSWRLTGWLLDGARVILSAQERSSSSSSGSSRWVHWERPFPVTCKPEQDVGPRVGARHSQHGVV